MKITPLSLWCGVGVRRGQCRRAGAPGAGAERNPAVRGAGGAPETVRTAVPPRPSPTTMPEKTDKLKHLRRCRLLVVIDESYRPTVAQLRAFVAVAEYRHFGAAAQRLGVSQPTLSQALSSLETGLGVALIERSTRKVLVTEAGRELLGRALTALEAVDGF